MKSGGHGGGIKFINKTEHDLSHSDADALKAKVKGIKGVSQVIVDETEHSTGGPHALELKYATHEGTFLYCKTAGGDFSQVLQKLKTCQKQGWGF